MKTQSDYRQIVPLLKSLIQRVETESNYQALAEEIRNLGHFVWDEVYASEGRFNYAVDAIAGHAFSHSSCAVRLVALEALRVMYECWGCLWDRIQRDGGQSARIIQTVASLQFCQDHRFVAPATRLLMAIGSDQAYQALNQKAPKQ